MGQGQCRPRQLHPGSNQPAPLRATTRAGPTTRTPAIMGPATRRDRARGTGSGSGTDETESDYLPTPDPRNGRAAPDAETRTEGAPTTGCRPVGASTRRGESARDSTPEGIRRAARNSERSPAGATSPRVGG